MSLQSVRAFLAHRAPDIEVVELDASIATVALAAEALGVAPVRSPRLYRCGRATT